MLKNIADKKDNVFLLDLICFEYTLLEFNKLIDWIYAPEDEFREKRKGVITAREKLVQIINSGEMNYKAIQEIMDYDRSLQNHNIEQLFEVSKGDLGVCWRQNCCEWTDRQKDDICRLETTRLSLNNKMKCIYYETSIHRNFESIDLEVLA